MENGGRVYCFDVEYEYEYEYKVGMRTEFRCYRRGPPLDTPLAEYPFSADMVMYKRHVTNNTNKR